MSKAGQYSDRAYMLSQLSWDKKKRLEKSDHVKEIKACSHLSRSHRKGRRDMNHSQSTQSRKERGEQEVKRQIL